MNYRRLGSVLVKLVLSIVGVEIVEVIFWYRRRESEDVRLFFEE